MRWQNWEVLHGELLQCPWFENVGKEISEPVKLTRAISSWDVATQWSRAEISWWCVNEASNLLRRHLSNNHRQDYRKWNVIIQSFTPSIDDLLHKSVLPSLPSHVERPVILDWIRSHLTSAYLEVAFSGIADVELVCDQVRWYLDGHFPCGWFVPNEEGFPNDSITVVF